MKTIYLSLLLLLCAASVAAAQAIPESANKTSKTGKREGEWTIWYTKDWQVTRHPDSVLYYRRITYHKNKPVGAVRDYYKNGKVQWEGFLLADRPEDVMDGKAVWYDEDGNKQTEQVFKKGKQLSEVRYKPDGSIQVPGSSWAELNLAGEQYYDNGEYQKALDVFEKARMQAEAEAINEYPDYVSTLFSLALTYETLGIYQKAEPLYEQALQLTEKAIGKDDLEYGSIFNNLGLLYESMGNYQKAEPLLLESLQITERTLGKQHEEYATSLHNLANLYESMGKYELVEPLLLEALQITEKALGKDHPDYATTLHNLAMLYQRKGNYQEAESLFKQDMQIVEKTLGKAHPHYASSLNNLALLYSAMGKDQLAEPLYLQALQIREKTLGTSHPHYVFSIGDLADLHRRQGNYQQTEPLLLEVNRQLLNQMDKVFPMLSESEKAQFYQKISARFESFNSFVLLRQKQNPAIVADMYNNQLATKASLFNAANKVRQHILTSNDEGLKMRYQQWLEKKNDLAKIYQLSKEEKQKRRLDEKKLEQEVNALEKQLSLQSEAFATTTDKKRYSWQDVQKTLQANEACIEMVRFRRVSQVWTDTIYYAALIVTPASSLPELVLLENGNDLEGKYAKFYQNAIRAGLLTGDKADSRADSLYYHYWGKIDAVIKQAGATKVYFSPDGVYNRINLNTLYNPLSGKFVLDEVDIQLLTNTKDLVSRKRNTHAISNAALFGYPDYSQAVQSTQKLFSPLPPLAASPLPVDSLKRSLRDGILVMLKGSEKEVNTIGQILSENQIQVDKFMKSQASEEALKNVNNPGVLHIATHGFFMAANTGQQGNTGSINNGKMAENPLLRSGLYLAGAQQSLDGKTSSDSTENGILTAYEAMNLNLDHTDLVVLSACETGLGEIKNGEGVYGLQRAFQTAGARSVLMSLWKVDDAATSELMTLFYAQWLKTGNKREAFMMAQYSIRARYPDPYYWGAFVLVGE